MREAIRSLEIMRVAVPRQGSFSLQRGTTPPESPFTVARLVTESGVVGYGEGCTTATGLEVAARDHLVDVVAGRDVFDLTGLHRAMDTIEMMRVERLSHWNVVRAAIDMAVWDARGKLLGASVSELLGGRQRDAVEVVKNVGVSDPETSAATAREYVAEGYGIVKMRVGQDRRQDLDRVAAVREAVGPGISIRLDANQAWDPTTAVAMIHRLEPFGIEAVESPCKYWDVRGAREVVQRVDVPIIADEAFWTLAEAQVLLSSRAADVLHVYLGKCGGLTPGQKIATVAEAFDAAVSPGERVPLGIAEAAHVHYAASLPRLDFPCALSYDLNCDHLLVAGLEKSGGRIAVPDGPGLGIEVDEERLERYRAG